jgi:hypothetical protein
MENPKTIDEILNDLYWEGQHDNGNHEFWQGHVNKTKQALAEWIRSKKPRPGNVIVEDWGTFTVNGGHVPTADEFEQALLADLEEDD